MKILTFAAFLGLSVGLAACQNPEAGPHEKAIAPKTFAGEAVGRAKAISKTADDHNRMIEEQAGE